MVNKRLFKIIWDRQALDNFKEILTFISKQSPQAPRIVKNGVLSKLKTIKINPFICETDKLNEAQNEEFRAFIIYSYRVTYQIKMTTKEIRILRIRHTSMEPLEY